ncbi:hypothetical protein B0F90DRAFT_1817224 [Multifurca ochricompacta]|uniref:Protein YAE1 n=1 Tax=Multifurca ochricompacta TaxID=376703 RepID=A0AAD4QNT4_9AGAM|nr:hypothetical protein B0F90DRAFT_1817224 [Multifurca ochricompacta]
MPYDFISISSQPTQQDDLESPWEDTDNTPSTTTAHTEAEWTRLSSGFQNAGYRDGITEGKEGALQEGFDSGFARAGAPRGRELGLLRGLASSLLLHLTHTTHVSPPAAPAPAPASASDPTPNTSILVSVIREISEALANVRFADIAPPPPPEEEEHMLEELGGSNSGKEEEGSSAAGGGHAGSRLTIEDVRALREKLEALLLQVGLKVDLNLDDDDN